MPLTELLISGANASVVVFVVSSTLSVGLALTVPQILAPLRAWHPPTAGRIRAFVAPVSSVSMIFVVVLTTAGHLGSMVSVLGSFGIMAAIIFVTVCFGIGWLLGGPGPETRGVLSLGTAQ